MEKSRKTILAGLALLFISQFFTYEPSGHTTITMDLGRNLTTGGLPYGGGNGWHYHTLWAALVMAGIGWFFYSSSRNIVIYIIALLLFIGMGLGSGFGGILGLISIVIAGYSIYLKSKEMKLIK